jgi:hypothetical protein
MGQALQEQANEPSLGLERARLLLSEALAELDRCAAPADIGAHLDLALHRIGSELGKR